MGLAFMTIMNSSAMANHQPGILAAQGLLRCLAATCDTLPEGETLFLCGVLMPSSQGAAALPGKGDLWPDLLVRLAGRWGLAPLETDHERAVPQAEAPREGVISGFLRTAKHPRWRLAAVTAHDFSAFSTLFAQVFGQAITPELWHWKYGQGQGCAVGAWRGGELVAHYGGSLRRVLAFGQPVWALQVCDAMVEPRERAVMTKTGAMFQVTATFLELYQGLAGIPLAFGFPNRRAMKLGERLGFYSEVGTLVELRWPPLSRRPRLATRLAYLDLNSTADKGAVERLWLAMARDLAGAIIGVRDWKHLRYRYLDHPERQYELLLVNSRFTGRPLGLLVLQREADAVALTDLVAPLRHLPALLVQARRLTGLWGKASLYGWITRQHARHFPTTDLQSRDIDVSIPTNTWVQQPFPPDRLKDRWWLMCGDTDFL